MYPSPMVMPSRPITLPQDLNMDNMSISQMQQLVVQYQGQQSVQSINNVQVQQDQTTSIEELTKKIKELEANRDRTVTADTNDTSRGSQPTPGETNPFAYQRRPCYNCQETGHNQRNCPKPCSNCGDTNHTNSGCRATRRQQDFQ